MQRTSNVYHMKCIAYMKCISYETNIKCISYEMYIISADAALQMRYYNMNTHTHTNQETTVRTHMHMVIRKKRNTSPAKGCHSPIAVSFLLFFSVKVQPNDPNTTRGSVFEPVPPPPLDFAPPLGDTLFLPV